MSPFILKALAIGSGVSAAAVVLLMTASNVGLLGKRPVQDWLAIAGIGGVVGAGCLGGYEAVRRRQSAKFAPQSAAPARQRLSASATPRSEGAEVAIALGRNLTSFEPGSQDFNSVLFASRDFLQDYSRETGTAGDYEVIYQEEKAIHEISATTNPGASAPAPAPSLPAVAESAPAPLPNLTEKRPPLCFPDEPEPELVPADNRPEPLSRAIPTQGREEDLSADHWADDEYNPFAAA